MRSSIRSVRSAVVGTWAFVLSVLALGCQTEGQPADGGMGGGATGGAPTGGGTQGATGGSDSVGGMGGADPACKCRSDVCGTTLSEYDAAYDTPHCTNSSWTLRWKAGDDCDLTVYYDDMTDCTFRVYFGADGEVAGTGMSCAGAGSCRTFETEPSVCPGTECAICDPGGISGFPPCEPL